MSPKMDKPNLNGNENAFTYGKISPEKRRAILNKIKSSLHPLLEMCRKLFLLFTREFGANTSAKSITHRM